MHMRTANLLGAAALAINGRVIADVVTHTGLSPSATAALVVLSNSDGVTVTDLGRRVGLSQSAAARMVDSLEAAGHASRSTRCGRDCIVRISASGRDVALGAGQARQGWLHSLVAALDDSEAVHLTHILEKLLTAIYSEQPNSELLCRLCDRAACVDQSYCPVGRAEREAAV